MGWEYEGSNPLSPALRSGSLRSPPLRAGEREERTETTNTITYKSTKLFSGLDLTNVNPATLLKQMFVGEGVRNPMISPDFALSVN